MPCDFIPFQNRNRVLDCKGDGEPGFVVTSWLPSRCKLLEVICRNARKSFMSTAKQDVELLLNKLPDDCTVEDIQYHLYVLDKVRRGLEDARVNGTLSHEEVESRLSKWLIE